MEHDNNANMPVAFTVTNEMLYEMIRDFKADVNRRFDDVERRMDQLEYRMDRLEKRMDKVEQRLDEIYESRKSITVRFTNGWAFASLFMAVFSSGFVLVVGRAF